MATKAVRSGQAGVVLLCVLVGFWNPYIGSTMEIALPVLAQKLALSTNLYNWILLMSTLAAAVCFFPAGNLSDRFGRRTMLLWGIGLTLAALLVSGAAANGIWLLVMMAIISLGGAILYVNALALACSCFSSADSGKVIGLISAAIYAGRMLGPVCAGVIIKWWGWRWVFWSAALLAPVLLVLLLVIGRRIVEEKPPVAGFDWTGMAIFGSGIVLFIYGFTLIGSGRWAALFIALGALLLLGFVFWERRAANPLVPIHIFVGNSLLIRSLLTVLLCYTATYGMANIMSLYLQYTRAISPQMAGLMLAVLPLMQVIFSPLSGRAADTFPAHRVATVGIMVANLGLLMLLLVSMNSSILYLALGLAALGVGLAFISAPNTKSVLSAVPPAYLSQGSGLIGEFRNIGQSFSIGIINVVLMQVLAGQVLSPIFAAEILLTFKIATALFLVVGIGAAILSATRKNC